MEIDIYQQLFTVHEVAELAGVSVQAIYKAWNAGKFPTSSKAGSMHIINRKDVISYLAKRKQAQEEQGDENE